jgi:hypothetical protein
VGCGSELPGSCMLTEEGQGLTEGLMPEIEGQ